MAYSELIKSFGRIRDYMRQFYVYGFKSRDEYDAKSARSYDNERRRIESWLGGYMDFRQNASGKRVFISVDSRQTAHNPLYRAFKAKSFTDRDIVLHFCILDILADGASHTTRDITDLIDCMMPDESTVRKKLREYEALGLVVSEKHGRDVLYRLADDIPSPEAWRDALEFYSESNLLGVVGSYLLDRQEDGDSIFRFKHHYILQALESEILCSLLGCMGEKRTAAVTMVSANPESAPVYTVIPLRIRASTQEGRYYLLAWDGVSEQYRPFRLDRIQSVEPGKPCEDYDSLLSGLCEFTSRLWGASTGNYPETEHIEMTLRIGENEGYILSRLEREKRCGRVDRPDEHTARFTADVYDAMELMPWLRTFTGRIEKLECSNPVVAECYWSDLKAALAMYGGERDAVQ